MNKLYLQLFMENDWNQIITYLKKSFKIEATVSNALFLIGVNELGYGFKKLDQQEKTKVINFASIYIMKFLSSQDKKKLAEASEDMNLAEDVIYKKAIINYFEYKGIIKSKKDD